MKYDLVLSTYSQNVKLNSRADQLTEITRLLINFNKCLNRNGYKTDIEKSFSPVPIAVILVIRSNDSLIPSLRSIKYTKSVSESLGYNAKHFSKQEC